MLYTAWYCIHHKWLNIFSRTHPIGIWYRKWWEIGPLLASLYKHFEFELNMVVELRFCVLWWLFSLLSGQSVHFCNTLNDSIVNWFMCPHFSLRGCHLGLWHGTASLHSSQSFPQSWFIMASKKISGQSVSPFEHNVRVKHNFLLMLHCMMILTFLISPAGTHWLW